MVERLEEGGLESEHKADVRGAKDGKGEAPETACITGYGSATSVQAHGPLYLRVLLLRQMRCSLSSSDPRGKVHTRMVGVKVLAGKEIDGHCAHSARAWGLPELPEESVKSTRRAEGTAESTKTVSWSVLRHHL